ncbi:MAG: helix-turn-helix domain-containing protein [Oscillospiraceae bacterium]
MNTDNSSEWELTTGQLRTVMKLRKVYTDYPDGLGTKDVMKMLGVGRATVLNLKNSGMLQHINLGNRLLFPKEWVLEYLAVYAVSDKPGIADYRREVLKFCRTRKGITEIAEHINLGAGFCRDYLLKQLREQGRLICEIDKSNPKKHCYVARRGRGDTHSFAFLCWNEVYPKEQERKPNTNSVVANSATTASDGNKRIAAAMFLYFLDKNNVLFLDEAKTEKAIADQTLAALTIMKAESHPAEQEMMINVCNDTILKRFGYRDGNGWRIKK